MKKLLLTVLLSTTSLCYGMTIKFIPHEFAGFVHFLYENRDEALGSKLKALQFEQYTFGQPTVSLSMPRSNILEDQLFYDLSHLLAISDVDQALNNIKDEQQRQYLLSKIQAYYVTYQTKSHEAIDTNSYAQAANKLIKENANMIQGFLESALSFYGTRALPYDEIIVYIFPVEANKQVHKTFGFYNTILLSISDKEAIKNNLGTVMHEIAHMIYENQVAALQYNMEKLFLHEPSQYSFHKPSQYTYIAYKYLNEALATALGNGVFMEKLTGQPSMSYANDYIQGFAQAIYEDVKAYLYNKHTIDEAFLKKSIEQFAAAFPNATSHLEEILSRYVILSKHFDPEKAAKTFHEYFKANSHFYAVFDDKKEIEGDMQHGSYDHNSPVVFVLSQQEARNIHKLLKVHPYLKKLPELRGKQLQKGFYYLRDSADRLYMFFVIDSYNDLEKLLGKLKKQTYLSAFKEGAMDL